MIHELNVFVWYIYLIINIQKLPLYIREPLSVKVCNENEIIFFGDRRGHNGSCIIVYDINSDEYTILNDKQNYKSIGVETYRHCVFEHNNNNNNNTLEYISFDRNHIALYNHNETKMYKLSLNYINRNDSSAPSFPIFDPLCVSIKKSNCMC